QSQGPTRRLHNWLLDYLGRPRQVAFAGTVERLAGLDFSIEVQQVVSHITQIIVDVPWGIIRAGIDGFHVLNIQLAVAHRVHEAKPVIEMEEPNVDPQRQWNLLLFLAFEPDFAKCRVIAQNLPVGIEIAENSRRA